MSSRLRDALVKLLSSPLRKALAVTFVSILAVAIYRAMAIFLSIRHIKTLVPEINLIEYNFSKPENLDFQLSFFDARSPVRVNFSNIKGSVQLPDKDKLVDFHVKDILLNKKDPLKISLNTVIDDVRMQNVSDLLAKGGCQSTLSFVVCARFCFCSLYFHQDIVTTHTLSNSGNGFDFSKLKNMVRLTTDAEEPGSKSKNFGIDIEVDKYMIVKELKKAKAFANCNIVASVDDIDLHTDLSFVKSMRIHRFDLTAETPRFIKLSITTSRGDPALGNFIVNAVRNGGAAVCITGYKMRGWAPVMPCKPIFKLGCFPGETEKKAGGAPNAEQFQPGDIAINDITIGDGLSFDVLALQDTLAYNLFSSVRLLAPGSTLRMRLKVGSGSAFAVGVYIFPFACDERSPWGAYRQPPNGFSGRHASVNFDYADGPLLHQIGWSTDMFRSQKGFLSFLGFKDSRSDLGSFSREGLCRVVVDGISAAGLRAALESSDQVFEFSSEEGVFTLLNGISLRVASDLSVSLSCGSNKCVLYSGAKHPRACSDEPCANKDAKKEQNLLGDIFNNTTMYHRVVKSSAVNGRAYMISNLSLGKAAVAPTERTIRLKLPDIELGLVSEDGSISTVLKSAEYNFYLDKMKLSADVKIETIFQFNIFDDRALDCELYQKYWDCDNFVRIFGNSLGISPGALCSIFEKIKSGRDAPSNGKWAMPVYFVPVDVVELEGAGPNNRINFRVVNRHCPATASVAAGEPGTKTDTGLEVFDPYKLYMRLKKTIGNKLLPAGFHMKHSVNFYMLSLGIKERGQQNTLWDGSEPPFVMTQEVCYRFPSFIGKALASSKNEDASFSAVLGLCVLNPGFSVSILDSAVLAYVDAPLDCSFFMNNADKLPRFMNGVVFTKILPPGSCDPLGSVCTSVLNGLLAGKRVAEEVADATGLLSRHCFSRVMINSEAEFKMHRGGDTAKLDASIVLPKALLDVTKYVRIVDLEALAFRTGFYKKENEDSEDNVFALDVKFDSVNSSEITEFVESSKRQKQTAGQGNEEKSYREMIQHILKGTPSASAEQHYKSAIPRKACSGKCARCNSACGKCDKKAGGTPQSDDSAFYRCDTVCGVCGELCLANTGLSMLESDFRKIKLTAKVDLHACNLQNRRDVMYGKSSSGRSSCCMKGPVCSHDSVENAGVYVGLSVNNAVKLKFKFDIAAAKEMFVAFAKSNESLYDSLLKGEMAKNYFKDLVPTPERTPISPEDLRDYVKSLSLLNIFILSVKNSADTLIGDFEVYNRGVDYFITRSVPAILAKLPRYLVLPQYLVAKMEFKSPIIMEVFWPKVHDCSKSAKCSRAAFSIENLLVGIDSVYPMLYPAEVHVVNALNYMEESMKCIYGDEIIPVGEPFKNDGTGDNIIVPVDETRKAEEIQGELAVAVSDIVEGSKKNTLAGAKPGENAEIGVNAPPPSSGEKACNCDYSAFETNANTPFSGSRSGGESAENEYEPDAPSAGICVGEQSCVTRESLKENAHSLRVKLDLRLNLWKFYVSNPGADVQSNCWGKGLCSIIKGKVASQYDMPVPIAIRYNGELDFVLDVHLPFVRFNFLNGQTVTLVMQLLQSSGLAAVGVLGSNMVDPRVIPYGFGLSVPFKIMNALSGHYIKTGMKGTSQIATIRLSDKERLVFFNTILDCLSKASMESNLGMRMRLLLKTASFLTIVSEKTPKEVHNLIALVMLYVLSVERKEKYVFEKVYCIRPEKLPETESDSSKIEPVVASSKAVSKAKAKSKSSKDDDSFNFNELMYFDSGNHSYNREYFMGKSEAKLLSDVLRLRIHSPNPPFCLLAKLLKPIGEMAFNAIARILNNKSLSPEERFKKFKEWYDEHMKYYDDYIYPYGRFVMSVTNSFSSFSSFMAEVATSAKNAFLNLTKSGCDVISAGCKWVGNTLSAMGKELGNFAVSKFVSVRDSNIVQAMGEAKETIKRKGKACANAVQKDVEYAKNIGVSLLKIVKNLAGTAKDTDENADSGVSANASPVDAGDASVDPESNANVAGDVAPA